MLHQIMLFAACVDFIYYFLSPQHIKLEVWGEKETMECRPRGARNEGWKTQGERAIVCARGIRKPAFYVTTAISAYSLK